MGIAAYNRGSECLRRQIEAERVPDAIRNKLEIIERINSYPKGKSRPFAPVLIQPEKRRRVWWLMQDTPDRFSRFAYCYPSLRELMAAWNITIIGTGADGCGFYYRAIPTPKGGAN